MIQRVASQVADFCRRLIANCSNPFCVFFLFVMSPTSDLRRRAGTCLPPAMGWQHPVTSSTSSGTSAQSATGTDPAPCYDPFLFLARSQPGCSAPSPGPQPLLGHGSACTQVSPSKLCSLFSARSHTEKCVILYGVREISAY